MFFYNRHNLFQPLLTYSFDSPQLCLESRNVNDMLVLVLKKAVSVSNEKILHFFTAYFLDLAICFTVY